MQGIAANGTLISSKQIEQVISSGISGFVGIPSFFFYPTFISAMIF
jgi:hypothetical protein